MMRDNNVLGLGGSAPALPRTSKHLRQLRTLSFGERVANDKASLAQHLTTIPLHEADWLRRLLEVVMLARLRAHDWVRRERHRADQRYAIPLTVPVSVNDNEATAF
jgi:hypothetical protein